MLIFSLCWWPIVSNGITGMGSPVGCILCSFLLRGPFCSGRKGSWPHLQGCAALKEVLHIPSMRRSDKAPCPPSGSPSCLCIRLLEGAFTFYSTLWGPIGLRPGMWCQFSANPGCRFFTRTLCGALCLLLKNRLEYYSPG